MVKLYEAVKTLAEVEYARASVKFGATNNSSHESFAVLKEELDEAREENINVQILVDRYWSAVKENDMKKQADNLKDVYVHSLLAACEFIQTAAMAHKALKTIANNGSKNEQGEN